MLLLLMIIIIIVWMYRRKGRYNMRKNFWHWRLVTLFFFIVHRSADVHNIVLYYLDLTLRILMYFPFSFEGDKN